MVRPVIKGPHELSTSWPKADRDIARWTDHYFRRTKVIVEEIGDCTVTYAVFMRRPVISAPRLALDWLHGVTRDRGAEITIDTMYPEGKWVGAGEPIFYVTGRFTQLVDLETLLLQKLGPACVAAFNAYSMCADLPKVSFLAMDARHCCGTEMSEIMAYAASVGSDRARRKVGAIGFVGNATDATAHYFGREGGLGTMPHALIGFAGSTLEAAVMYDRLYPDEPMTVLVDYFAREITDSLAVANRFPARVGLDPTLSYAVLERNAPEAIRGYRTEEELRYLVGAGVTASAIWYLREKLDAAGFGKVRLVASSGFDPRKCHIMADAAAPVDVIGSGSFLPPRWSETYATADIVAYDGMERVKVGREFLLRKESV